MATLPGHRRCWPLLAVIGLFIAAAHLDLFAGLEPWTHTGILVALALALIGGSWWLFRAFRWPGRDSAARRLEIEVLPGALRVLA